MNAPVVIVGTGLADALSYWPYQAIAVGSLAHLAERRRAMRKWQCVVCGFIYDEALGWPDDGIAAGTRWEDVPQDWLCPDCGVGKLDFEMIEIN